jgi:hypothetical protein
MGSLCLTTVRRALNGNLDGPAIGDAIVKRKRDGIGGSEMEISSRDRVRD